MLLGKIADAEESDQGADCARLAAGAETVDRTDSWNHEAHRLEENLGGSAVELTTQDLKAIHDAVSAIDVQGDRYPASFQSLVNR